MKFFILLLLFIFSQNAFSQFAMNGFWSARSTEVKCLDSAPANIKLLLTGTSFVIPAGVTSIKAWVVGGGGGGAGSLNMDGSSGGGGGAGGMAYYEFAVVPGESMNLTFGPGGLGGNGSAADPLFQNGHNGGDTILLYNSVTMIGHGGQGGLMNNVSNTATGGVFSSSLPGIVGIKGGDSPGVSGDAGGSSGGAIGDVAGLKNFSQGSDGGLSTDFYGLKAVVESCGLSYVNNGKASTTNTSTYSDRNYGSHSRGVGCGGGSPGYWGGRGGAGFLGGGGAGSASYIQYNIGGKGGDGFIFLTWAP